MRRLASPLNPVGAGFVDKGVTAQTHPYIDCPAAAGLVEFADRIHSAARAALVPELPPGLPVGVLSRHLAANERILLPAVRHFAPELTDQAEALHKADAELVRLLWLLDRRTTGDMRTAQVSLPLLALDVRRHLERHADCELEMLWQLSGRIDAERLVDLQRRVCAAFDRSPSRPHPFFAAHPILGQVAFRLDGMVDRFRDVMDNRSVRPETQAARPATLWGSYLTGVPTFELPDGHEGPEG